MTEFYGVNLDSNGVKFKKDAAVLFMNLFYLTDECGQETFKTYCEDEELDPADDESKEKFVDSYENESLTFCSTGLEQLIADYINDHVFNHEVVFRYEDYILGVESTIPEDEEDKKRIPTKKQIKEALITYLNPLLEEPFHIGWYDIHD